ncbi:hypothetical protein [Altericroceibacterium xinjiangense]|uniref:hypothetical protein n=1 Tax=Altericroceibacterium xinjiangense TaxID=762261 RepID=UPI000F7E0705|nr:hypothetical protein [Altericroceibacterium xinjiangense]
MNTNDLPVLFIVFNRKDTSLEVLSAISDARPTRLYVAGDGARADRPGEAEQIEEVRRAVLEAIDWPCEVRTRFQDENLGCRRGVIAAIDWFFANEEEGIILEDDVVPSPDFFRFCAEMIERYRDEPRVMMVSGFNPLGAGVRSSTYLFSSLGSIWGWASWRDAWARYDVGMTGWNPALATRLRQRHGRATARYLSHMFDFHLRHNVDTWDTQWTFTIQAHDGLAVLPEANLIRNIGVVGTHSSIETRNHNVAHGEIIWPLAAKTREPIDDPEYRKRLTEEILGSAMLVSALSQTARKLRLHRLAKWVYQTFRKMRNRPRV